jgi:DNA repair exonuclease SbcCD ATPase subunit
MYDEYGRDAFTMTFVRRKKPIKLFELLRRDKHEVFHARKGIYEIKGHLPFRTQVIVTREWDDEEAEIHTWLRSLTNKSKGKELEGILAATPKLSDQHKKLADGLINVFAAANMEYMRGIKEDDSIMSEVVNELFADWTLREKERADAAEKRAAEAEAKTSAIETELGETKTELGKTKNRLSEAMKKIDDMSAQLQNALAEIASLKAAQS